MGASVQQAKRQFQFLNKIFIWVIKSRRLGSAGHVAKMEDDSGAFITLTGKPTGKGPLGRPMSRWENNIE